MRPLWEWQESETAPIPDAGEDVEEQELASVAGGNQNGAVTLEDILAVSYKTKHTLSIWFCKYISYLPK